MTKFANFTLLLDLRNDPGNPLSHRIGYMIDHKQLPSLEGRDGVIQLSDTAVLFENSKAHNIFVQLCSGLLSLKWSYLLVPIEKAEECMMVGTATKEQQAILKKYGIPFLDPQGQKVASP